MKLLQAGKVIANENVLRNLSDFIRLGQKCNLEFWLCTLMERRKKKEERREKNVEKQFSNKGLMLKTLKLKSAFAWLNIIPVNLMHAEIYMY